MMIQNFFLNHQINIKQLIFRILYKKRSFIPENGYTSSLVVENPNFSCQGTLASFQFWI